MDSDASVTGNIPMNNPTQKIPGKSWKSAVEFGTDVNFTELE